MIGGMGTIGRSALVVALAVAGLASATTAQAHERHRGGDDAVIAIGAGLVGLAIGAALADRDDRYYHDRGWYSQRRYVRVSGYPDYYYYYPGNPRLYYRDRYYHRNYRNWYDGRNPNRWERGQRRFDAYYGQRNWRDGYRSERGYRYRGDGYDGYRRGY